MIVAVTYLDQSYLRSMDRNRCGVIVRARHLSMMMYECSSSLVGAEKPACPLEL